MSGRGRSGLAAGTPPRSCHLLPWPCGPLPPHRSFGHVLGLPPPGQCGQTLLRPCSLSPTGSGPPWPHLFGAPPPPQDCGRQGAPERGPGTCVGSTSQSLVPQSHPGLGKVSRTLSSSLRVQKSGRFRENPGVGAAVLRTLDTWGADHPCPQGMDNESPTDNRQVQERTLLPLVGGPGKAFRSPTCRGDSGAWPRGPL